MIDFLGFPKDCVMVITGAGSGIGQKLAETAARQGIAVSAWDISAEGLETTAALLKSVGARHLLQICDVSNRDEAKQAMVQTYEKLGAVHSLAAIAAPPSFIKVKFEEGVNRTIQCVRNPVKAWIDAVPVGAKSGVFLSSVQGPRYGAGIEWYSVAKSAIDGYARSIAAMRPSGLRVNAVLPDWILTPRTQEFVHKTGGLEWDANPMHRVGLPEDVANLIMFLLSPAAGYINGQSIEVDGGARLRSLAWMRMAEASDSRHE